MTRSSLCSGEHIALLLACLACGGDDAPAQLVFVPVEHVTPFEANVTIDAVEPSAARSQVLDATRSAATSPTWIGGGPWQTVAVGPTDRDPQRSVELGRTFIRNGGSASLDVRMGAGDRGAFMGGIASMGAERAMLEVHVEDRDTLGARFVIRLHAIDSPRPRDTTPTYLQHAVPRGTYRAWVDVPPRGGRYVVEIQTVDRRGDVVGRAWASPIAVERPWL